MHTLLGAIAVLLFEGAIAVVYDCPTIDQLPSAAQIGVVVLFILTLFGGFGMFCFSLISELESKKENPK